jgi:hypothetical protein
VFVVLIFQRRTDKAGGEEVAVAQEIQEGNILSDSILLLLFGAFLSRKGPVFDVVSQKGVFAGEDHQESFSLHAPSAIVGVDLV